jgi:hypothetical protein
MKYENQSMWAMNLKEVVVFVGHSLITDPGSRGFWFMPQKLTSIKTE